ncbi:1-phosphofructokinase [Clostridia bacterium]|nr:1-phosphofructokinase [Clostridia bacterium]
MIYTVTLNPALDYDVFFNGFSDIALNLAEKVNYRAAGKGVNVSKMLSVLGEENTALGFVGGFTGGFIRSELSRYEGVTCAFTETSGVTRINVKLAANERGGEREITGVSPVVSEAELSAFFTEIAKIKQDDVVIMSGSVPAGVPRDIYKTIAKALPVWVKTALDVRGDMFLENVHANFFAKPNIAELSEIFGAELTTPQDALVYAEKLVEIGIENVIVSMGGNGAVFTDGNERYFLKAPQGEVVQTMGAGDSVTAGFIAGILGGKTKADSFKLGVACGSATAFSTDMGSLPLINELYEKINTEVMR